MDRLPLQTATVLAQAAAQPDDGGNPGWALALFGIALLLFVIELLVPTGGILGLLCAIALFSGIVLMFGVSTTWGLASIFVVLLASPFALLAAVKLFPHTPFARWITLKEEPAREPAAEPAPGPKVGQTGRALTDLRPVGTVVIDGKRETCLAQGGLIEEGTQVRVVAVDGMQIRVRPAQQASRQGP